MSILHAFSPSLPFSHNITLLPNSATTKTALLPIELKRSTPMPDINQSSFSMFVCRFICFLHLFAVCWNHTAVMLFVWIIVEITHLFWTWASSALSLSLYILLAFEVGTNVTEMNSTDHAQEMSVYKLVFVFADFICTHDCSLMTGWCSTVTLWWSLIVVNDVQIETLESRAHT